MRRSKTDMLNEQAQVLYELGMMLRAKLGISAALDIVAQVSDGYGKVFSDMKKGMGQENKSMKDCLPTPESGEYFMPFVPVLVGVAENYGGLGQMLVRAGKIVKRIAQIETKSGGEGPPIDESLAATALDFLILAHLRDRLDTLPALKALYENCSSENKDPFRITLGLTEIDGSLHALSDAMRVGCRAILMPNGQGMVIDEPYIGFIRSAEADGSLNVGLKRLANLMMTNLLDIEIFERIEESESAND